MKVSKKLICAIKNNPPSKQAIAHSSFESRGISPMHRGSLVSEGVSPRFKRIMKENKACMSTVASRKKLFLELQNKVRKL